MEYHLHNDPGIMANSELVIDLLDNLTKKKNYPTGLKIGEFFNFDLLPEMGVFLSSCRTLKDALPTLILAANSLAPFYNIRTEEEGETLAIFVDITERSVENHADFLVEFLFSSFVKFTKIVTFGKIALDKAIFSHRLNGSINEYRKIFNSTIFAGSTNNALVFPSWFMDARIENPLADYNQRARAVIERKLGQYIEHTTISNSVLRSLLLADNLVEHDLETISKNMSISKRTLQRKLRSEGLSFKKLSNISKYEKAKELLANSNMSIEEISINLGFSDRRSFARAFQRISGLSPFKFRRNCSSAASVTYDIVA